MDDASSPPQHIVDGRLVVDELPARVALLPGEVELVACYLLDALNTLLGVERASPDTPGAPERRSGKAAPCGHTGDADDRGGGTPYVYAG